LRGRSQNLGARQSSLQELQAAALGKYDDAMNGWLQQRGLQDAPRLARLVQAEPGWEKAVERVLGVDLGAVCVNDLDGLAAEVAQLQQTDLVMFDLSGRCSNIAAGAHPRL